jgi:hypothetical protein
LNKIICEMTNNKEPILQITNKIEDLYQNIEDHITMRYKTWSFEIFRETISSLHTCKIVLKKIKDNLKIVEEKQEEILKSCLYLANLAYTIFYKDFTSSSGYVVHDFISFNSVSKIMRDSNSIVSDILKINPKLKYNRYSQEQVTDKGFITDQKNIEAITQMLYS